MRVNLRGATLHTLAPQLLLALVLPRPQDVWTQRFAKIQEKILGYKFEQQQHQDQSPKAIDKQQNLVEHFLQPARRSYFTSSVGQRPTGLALPVGSAPLPSPARSSRWQLHTPHAAGRLHREDSEETLRMGETAHCLASHAHR